MSSLISHHPLGEEGIGGHNPFQGEVMGLSQGHAGQLEALGPDSQPGPLPNAGNRLG